MSEPHIAVTVSLNGDDFLTIETNCLSGGDIGEREEEAIRWAIDHLSAFIADKRNADAIAAAYRAGRIAQAEEDAGWHDNQASLLTSTATSDAGYVALLRALHVRSAASIRANIAKLKDEATK